MLLVRHLSILKANHDPAISKKQCALMCDVHQVLFSTSISLLRTPCTIPCLACRCDEMRRRKISEVVVMTEVRRLEVSTSPYDENTDLPTAIKQNNLMIA